VSVHTLPGALHRFAGVGANSSGHLEKWVSGAGGLSGILGVMLISQAYLELSGSAALVASMGASAVLLFAVPHGPLSQPWAVFGGHLVSATIGVSCARLFADPVIAAALAVALSISAMYYLRCIHPPGGATALTAVAGGDAVHFLGFHYVLTPVMLNVLVILLIAMLFNLPFPWRRYPAVWARKQSLPAAPPAGEPHAGITGSRQGNGEGYTDTVYKHGVLNTESGIQHPAGIRVGGYYCNGTFGPDWQVRQLIDSSGSGTTGPGMDDMVSYKVVAGKEHRRTGTARREVFTGWARYEVSLNEIPGSESLPHPLCLDA